MWLNQLFIENPIDFEKRCRNRIVFGICFILLGAAAIGLSFAVRNRAMVMYLEQGYREFMPGFYGGGLWPGCSRYGIHYPQPAVSEKPGA